MVQKPIDEEDDFEEDEVTDEDLDAMDEDDLPPRKLAAKTPVKAQVPPAMPPRRPMPIGVQPNRPAAQQMPARPQNNVTAAAKSPDRFALDIREAFAGLKDSITGQSMGTLEVNLLILNYLERIASAVGA